MGKNMFWRQSTSECALNLLCFSYNTLRAIHTFLIAQYSYSLHTDMTDF